MSGELHETVYDSGYRPNLRSARDVLAFLLTPIEVVGPIGVDDYEPICEMFNEAKRQAFVEWRRLNKSR
jgi:hypothetical protein